MSGTTQEVPLALDDITDAVLAVRLPVPLGRIARYLRGWSKQARTQQVGEWLVVIDPAARRGE
jgi:hypothetical protein